MNNTSFNNSIPPNHSQLFCPANFSTPIHYETPMCSTQNKLNQFVKEEIFLQSDLCDNIYTLDHFFSAYDNIQSRMENDPPYKTTIMNCIKDDAKEQGVFFPTHADDETSLLINQFSDGYRTYMWYESCTSGDIGACASYLGTKVTTGVMLSLTKDPRHELSYKLQKLAAETFSEIKNIVTIHQCRQTWSRCAAAFGFQAATSFLGY